MYNISLIYLTKYLYIYTLSNYKYLFNLFIYYNKMADIDVKPDQNADQLFKIGVFDRQLKSTNINSWVYAFGDIHGDIEALLSCLIDVAKVMKIENGKPVWIGKSNWVIFCGDLVDRARNHTIERGEGEILYEEEKILYIIRYLDKLARRDNGRIITIIGNHEMMNLERDFRYVSKFCLTQNNTINNKVQRDNNRQKRFTKGGVINYLLRNDNSIYAIVRIDDFIFCHGGIIMDTVKLVCQKFIDNNANNKCEDQNDLFREINNRATECFDNINIGWPHKTQKFGDKFSKKNGYHTNVLWNRKWGESVCSDNECNLFDTLRNYIKPYHIDMNLVVGHCPQPFSKTKPTNINSCCNERLWRIDVAMTRGFDMPYLGGAATQVYWRAIDQAFNLPESEWENDVDIKKVNEYNKIRKPQALEIMTKQLDNSVDDSGTVSSTRVYPDVEEGKKHLPRNDIKREVKKRYIKHPNKNKLNKVYKLFHLDNNSTYKPRANNIRFPPDYIFKNNDLKGLLKFMDKQREDFFTSLDKSVKMDYNNPFEGLPRQENIKKKQQNVTSQKNSTKGGRKKRNVSKIKKVRKHKGIIQIGGNAGRLRKGYRYSGKKLKSGLPQIIKCKSKY